MRVGVVCEGVTDYHAISQFVEDALSRNGIPVEFVPIQPDVDNTRPVGGWGNVMLWLEKNPPEKRILNYFGGGLFAGELGTEALDCIVFQLDGDVIGDISFASYIDRKFGYSVKNVGDPVEKSQQIREILEIASGIGAITHSDSQKHVFTASIESIETWCLAAFFPVPDDYEKLTANALVETFMKALEKSEGRIPKDSYTEIDKTIGRRVLFCRKHKSGSDRIEKSCPNFSELVNALRGLSKAAR